MNCLRLLCLTERQTYSLSKIPSAKYISHHPMRFMETQDMWREKDGVSKRWQLIYKAPMSTALNFATSYLTCTTSIIGISTIYYGAFVYDSADLNKPVLLGDDVIIANSPIDCLIYLGAFVALHVAVKVLLAKFVVRLYRDRDQYIAIYRGHWYNSIRKHEFNLYDFKKVKSSSLLPWSESRYILGNKKGIVLENNFKSPEYFNYLLTKRKPNMDEEE